MTSFKKMIAGLFASAMCFSFFAASSKIDYVKLGTENTPENSVVMIFAGYNEFAVRQINPEFPVNKFKVKEDSGCTPPLVPGSCYMIHSYDVPVKGKAPGLPCMGYLWTISLNAKEPEHFGYGTKISVPTEPGLYVYYVQYDIDAIKDSNRIIIGNVDNMNDLDAWKKSSVVRNKMKKIFEKSAKLYAGTEWEELINEYVKEWSK